MFFHLFTPIPKAYTHWKSLVLFAVFLQKSFSFPHQPYMNPLFTMIVDSAPIVKCVHLKFTEEIQLCFSVKNRIPFLCTSLIFSSCFLPQTCLNTGFLVVLFPIPSFLPSCHIEKTAVIFCHAIQLSPLRFILLSSSTSTSPLYSTSFFTSDIRL